MFLTREFLSIDKGPVCMTLFAPFIVLNGGAETSSLRPLETCAGFMQWHFWSTLLRNGNVYSDKFDIGVTVW